MILKFFKFCIQLIAKLIEALMVLYLFSCVYVKKYKLAFRQEIVLTILSKTLHLCTLLDSKNIKEAKF
jgi:hypothetical protein